MEIVKTDLRLPDSQHKLAFTLDNVLTQEECHQLICQASEQGYEAAQINVGGGHQVLATDVRKGERCIIDSKERADWLWDKVKAYVPPTWKGYPVVGLNERLRFLAYGPGDYFKSHCDGSYSRPDGGQISYLTLQLYLNGGFQGGDTTFLSVRPTTKPNKMERFKCKLGEME